MTMLTSDGRELDRKALGARLKSETSGVEYQIIEVHDYYVVLRSERQSCWFLGKMHFDLLIAGGNLRAI